MSETVISLDALGVLMRRMQGDIRAIDVKLDLLQRARDRDVASAVTREDLRNVITVLAERLAGFDQRITSAVEQMAEHITETQRQIANSDDTADQRFNRMDQVLAEILARLPPITSPPANGRPQA